MSKHIVATKRDLWMYSRGFLADCYAADESPKMIEGSACPDKVVIMAFPDEAAFHAWADSAEYQEISRDRKAGANTTVLLVQALTA